MTTCKWTIVAGILTLSGCGGGAEAPPAEPAGANPVAAKPGTAAPVPKQQSDWKPYNSAEGGFSVLLPGTPEVTSQPGKLFTVHIVSCEHQGVTFTVTYFNPPPRAVAPDVVDATMKRDRDMSIQDIQGSLKSEEKVAIRKDGKDWPGLSSVIENSSDLYTSRLYAVAGRMYSLQVKHAKSQDTTADITRFFDSFKFSDGAKPD
jgi:hypothetical protein